MPGSPACSQFETKSTLQFGQMKDISTEYVYTCESWIKRNIHIIPEMIPGIYTTINTTTAAKCIRDVGATVVHMI